ncbi:uncharacterized protein LAESUDRAFT_728572 [Laetiporus sulphureus 93-53]|uniref:Uncharacterized protein n=1 Tax=Laetiporus sulphureus 93-53 TaxID=1314785 RepID=A0A165D0I9_9APHY|nr:uncharacterized protein LAESUDRAFT_728572 [Laetiporus sulphureus 93-53]KZT03890.1 hypothetical protein LAESUDRAFT_728572 [Laetiporus sulphureus 93-53]
MATSCASICAGAFKRHKHVSPLPAVFYTHGSLGKQQETMCYLAFCPRSNETAKKIPLCMFGLGLVEVMRLEIPRWQRKARSEGHIL